MNFVTTFKEGKSGNAIGLTTGIPMLDVALNGIHRKYTYAIAAAPKVGKTTLADFCFLLSPYLQAEKEGTLDKIKWTYFSFEIDRISKEFKFAAFFMYHDYDVATFQYKGKTYPMSQDYLMGRLLHRDGDLIEPILVTPEHEEMLKKIYEKRIVPLFGRYNDKGIRVNEGLIDYIEVADTPTNIRKVVIDYANKHGTFNYENYQVLDNNGNKISKKRMVSYVPGDPLAYHFFIIDHIRKFKREKGLSMKENIDKWLEYQTELRNVCKFTFIDIIHLNRGLSNIDRLKYMSNVIYPTADDIKDSGNVSEETTALLTMFNPGDEKYNIETHFGTNVKAHPHYRSIHLADSRYTECPQHIQTNMYGGINTFTPL